MNPRFSISPKKALSLLGMATVLTLSSCDDDAVDPIDNTPDETTVELPTTYNFENVDYSGQLARLQMVNMLVGKAREANDGTTVITEDELNAIYANESGDLFGTDKQIKDKTSDPAKTEMGTYFAMIEELSGDTANLVGGRLYSETGVEPVQMIAKGLMGALMYYQATSVYLEDEKMSADNTSVTEGKGTAMEHHWDEAFGYFGAPTDFLTEEVPEGTEDPAEKVWFWASYANQRKDVVDVREEIFNAFIAGRAAISRGDLEARDEAIATIKENWELLVAANAVHYINSALENLENNAEGDFYHHMSEGKAFFNGLRYNLDKSITTEQINEIDALIGEDFKEDFNNPEETKEDLTEALVKIQEIFEFTDSQMLNL